MNAPTLAALAITIQLLSVSPMAGTAGLSQAGLGPDGGQQDITGRWVGDLRVPNGSVPMVFRIEREAGRLTARAGSVNNPAAFIARSVTFQDGRLVIEIAEIEGGYTGTLLENGTIEGTWKQNGQELPLNLERSDPPLRTDR